MQADQSPVISTFCLVATFIPAFTDSFFCPRLTGCVESAEMEEKRQILAQSVIVNPQGKRNNKSHELP